jgi:hypothetical protein
VYGILGARDGLATFGIKLPGHINVLTGALLDKVKGLVDASINAKSELFLYSLVLVMSRLSAPWQLIRLGTKAAGGDEAARIEETSYGLAIDHCSTSERSFRQSQVDAAVRFCAKVFGDEYASLLSKAADVASQSERKAVAAARA